MPKLGVCADLGADDSDRLCQQLLEVKVGPLPDNAGQLQNLLESGKVVVTQVGSCWDCALLQDLLNALSLPSGCLVKGSAIVCSASRYLSHSCTSGYLPERQTSAPRPSHTWTGGASRTLGHTHCFWLFGPRYAKVSPLKVTVQRQLRRVASHHAGKSEEPTAYIVMALIIRTWKILCHFAPINHRLDFSWGRNQGLGSVEPSAHDPSTVSLYVLALPSRKAVHAAWRMMQLVANNAADCRAECGQT